MKIDEFAEKLPAVLTKLGGTTVISVNWYTDAVNIHVQDAAKCGPCLTTYQRRIDMYRVETMIDGFVIFSLLKAEEDYVPSNHASTIKPQ